MTDTFWSDISTFQQPVDVTYPYPLMSLSRLPPRLE